MESIANYYRIQNGTMEGASDSRMRSTMYITAQSQKFPLGGVKQQAKDKDEAHHPKGKGKAKKSIESKPVRKELAPQTRCLTPTVVDNSNSNSYDDGLMVEDEIHISDNEITFKTSFEEDNNGNDGTADFFSGNERSPSIQNELADLFSASNQGND